MDAPAEQLKAGRTRPWVAAAVAVAAAGLALAPGAAAALVMDRSAVLAGGWWRLWTGHLVHFGAGHLWWNLAVWLPAAAWLELVAPGRLRWFAATAPAGISLLLLAAAPDLVRYGGLSGLATGVLVLLALDRLAAGAGRGLWIATLALVAVKTGLEAVAGGTLFAGLPTGVRPVPLAHAGGIVLGFIVFAPGWAKKKLR